MLLFRSEGNLEAWLASGRGPRGARMDVATQWELARTWFSGRDRAEWRKRSPVEVEAVFHAAGLTGDFWRLSPAT